MALIKEVVRLGEWKAPSQRRASRQVGPDSWHTTIERITATRSGSVGRTSGVRLDTGLPRPVGSTKGKGRQGLCSAL